MAEDNEKLVGLAELIEQVKRELLLTSPDRATEVPLLGVDSVELELQITVKKEGKAGLKVYVLELGGGGSRDDVQKVKVKLSPLLDKATLLKIYKTQYPERWQEFLKTSSEALTKGSDEDLGDQF